MPFSSAWAGSSLAPEVFRKIFGVAPAYPDLAIQDSTSPDAVLAKSRELDPAQTVFIVSTKSGGTVETFSFMKYFYNRTADALGTEEAGRHFLAITDPGSGLADVARSLRFRHIFYNDPDIGGRYSALSCFGLVPASLIGMDTGRLLDRAAEAALELDEAGGGAAARLGVILGEMAKLGRDKLTFVFSRGLESFGDWIEQLIAESTGKEGKGILPVVGAPLGPPAVYGRDRLFVAIRLTGDESHEEDLIRLEAAGHPVIRIRIRGPYDIGAQCYTWELATAVAGARLGINPFDQPNVEAAKILARRIVSSAQEQGVLPEEAPDFTGDGLAMYGKTEGSHAKEILAHFFGEGTPGDYIAMQAYVQPTPAMDEALLRVRVAIRDRYRLATTVGYGPRFLHSTGQMHKGDAGRGLFLQITGDDFEDAPIPDEAGGRSSHLRFGVLKAAQALGDRQALMEAGRRVLRLHLKGDAPSRLSALLLP